MELDGIRRNPRLSVLEVEERDAGHHICTKLIQQAWEREERHAAAHS